MFEALQNYTPYEDSQQNIATGTLGPLVREFGTFSKPIERVLPLGTILYLSILDVYVTRNPLKPNCVGQPGSKKPSRKSSQVWPPLKLPHIFTITGARGSELIKSDLSVLPQVINHQEFHGVPFRFQQVVWLIVNWPPGGTIRGVSMGILIELDSLLGTHYYQTYGQSGRASLDELITAVRLLIRNHGIGCIVIDDIQNPLVDNFDDLQHLESFLTGLENKESACVIKIRTKEVDSSLETDNPTDEFAQYYKKELNNG